MSKPTEHNVRKLTRAAEVAMDSGHQNRFVVAGTNDDQADKPSSAGDKVLGVLRNQPASGGSATYAYSGVVLVEAGEAIAQDDWVATAADGQAVTATAANVDTTSSNTSQDVAGDAVAGRALGTADGAGELVPVLLTPNAGLV